MDKHKRCEICRGRQYIRLPLYRDVAMAGIDPFGPPISVEAHYRDYPCPECNPISAPVERVHLLEHHVAFRCDDVMPDGLKEAQWRRAAHMLVDGLMRSGFILFRRGPETEGDRIYGREASMWATVAVASTADAMRIEDRVKADREPYAAAVADEAIAQINNWGSYYGTTSLQKSEAIAAVRHAVDAVRKKFKREPV